MSRNWKRITLQLILLPLVALTSVACGDDLTTSGQDMQVSLLLTDALGDQVDNVWIEIEEIYLQGTNGREPLFTPGDGEALGLVELTELDDETVTLVEEKRVPAGSYGQMRFVVARAVLEAGGKFYSFNGAVPPDLENPEEFEPDGSLMCPSCSQSGLKVLLPQDEFPTEGERKIVMLDFDVARSFGRMAGMSGQWVMSPIIVATDVDLSGGVGGTVALDEGVSIPDCPAATETDPATEWDLTVFQATATARNLVDDDGDPVAFTDHPDAGGDLAFDFLDPDTYDMGFTSPLKVTDTHQLTFTATVVPTEIEVTSGSQSSVTYTIETAACEEIPSGS